MASKAIHRVPMELWDRIVSFTCEDETPEAAKKQCLIFCLTSRALNLAATCLLYRDVRTGFQGGNAARLLSTLFDSVLTSYVKTLRLTKNVGETKQRCEKEDDEMEFYKSCEQQFHDFSHGNEFALMPKTNMYAPFIPLWYAIEKFLDHGNDLKVLGQIIAQMQKGGLLGNLRTMHICLEGMTTQKTPFSSMDIVAAALSIPKLEQLSLEFNTLWNEDDQYTPQSSCATSSVKDIKMTSYMDYDEQSLYRLLINIKQCKNLEHLALDISSKVRGVDLPDGTRVRRPPAIVPSTSPEDIGLQFQTLLDCLLPHEETLKSLHIDAKLFHPTNPGAKGSFLAFKSLEDLRLDMTAERCSSLPLDYVKQLMAPNLKKLRVYVYFDTPYGFDTFGSAILSAPKSLQHLEVVFLATRVGYDARYPLHNRLYTELELFELEFNDPSSSSKPELFGVLRTRDLQRVVQHCETPDEASLSNKNELPIETLFQDDRIRQFVSGTPIVAELSSLYLEMFLAAGRNPAELGLRS